MDFEKNKRLQSIRVIISEMIMVITVVLMVIILAFIVSGYWLGSDFEVKRQGLLQVSSAPTGADVIIDGESSWLQKTNMSKVLVSGKHTVSLTKEGYDSWAKTIDIKEGLLYRLNYPRLFLQNRFSEKTIPVAGVTYATISPNGSSLILVNETTEWSYVNLEGEEVVSKKINIAPYFSSISLADDAEKGLFAGKILNVNWDGNSGKALFKVESNNGIEWVLLNPKEINDSVNLTREFGVDFTNLKIFDNNANTLLSVQNNNLHKVDVSGRSISAVLVENIIDFDYFNNEIVFSAKNPESENGDYYIGILKVGSDIKRLESSTEPAKVILMRFYEEEYILVLEGNYLAVYQKSDFAPVESFELDFSPASMKTGDTGGFVVAYNDSKIASLDFESMTIAEWEAEGATFGWIDSGMIYTIFNDELIVYDFDGLNRRSIAENVSAFFPVTITNNKYLYYFRDNVLVREWLIPR